MIWYLLIGVVIGYGIGWWHVMARLSKAKRAGDIVVRGAGEIIVRRTATE